MGPMGPQEHVERASRVDMCDCVCEGGYLARLTFLGNDCVHTFMINYKEKSVLKKEAENDLTPINSPNPNHKL